MMKDADLLQWALEQGGPAVRLRIHSAPQPEHAVLKLLAMEEVKVLFGFLDGFKTQARDKKTLEHLLHSYRETCIDHFFPRLMDMGFRAGIPAFDEKMQPVREVFAYLLMQDDAYCYHYRIMLHRFFFMAGYTHREVAASMQQRLEAIYQPAKEKVFDIYREENALPKKPKQWTGIGVLKEELDPFSKSAAKPLPTTYDIAAMAYFQDGDKNKENQPKIDAIVQYILEPDFQRIREGYGLLWDKEKRVYRACGWSPTLPPCEDDTPSPLFARSVLDALNVMSKFKAAHQAKWFERCVNHMERFRTEKGTYLFPKEYFGRKYPEKAFLSESNRTLKRGERESTLREVVSTLAMAEIKRNISEFAG